MSWAGGEAGGSGGGRREGRGKQVIEAGSREGWVTSCFPA